MANASLFLDKRFQLTDGTFRIRIRVSHERRSIYIKLRHSLTEKDYTKAITGRNMNNNEDLQKIRKDIFSAEAKANEILKDLHPFSFEEFQNLYNQTGDRNDIITLLNERSDEFKSENKFSSSNLYKQSASMFLKYVTEVKEQSVFRISELKPAELKNVEAWALNNGYNKTTIGMYMVRTKAILTPLINAGKLNKADYPFGKTKDNLYQIPKADNKKRPLTIDEIMKIYNYAAKTDVQTFAKDIFLFSYLASGMNMFDIFKLKRSDFDKESFSFIRQKTARSEKPEKITVLLNDDLRAIIERHGVHAISNDYVFKILKPSMTPLEENKAVRTAVSGINQALKSIAKELSITNLISTYYARHSFANILMQSEAPLAFISKKLGHKDLATTQSYLSQFSTAKEEQYTSNLLKKNIV